MQRRAVAAQEQGATRHALTTSDACKYAPDAMQKRHVVLANGITFLLLFISLISSDCFFGFLSSRETRTRNDLDSPLCSYLYTYIYVYIYVITSSLIG